MGFFTLFLYILGIAFIFGVGGFIFEKNQGFTNREAIQTFSGVFWAALFLLCFVLLVSFLCSYFI
ncbi:MAG: hypothetical protein HYX21_03495 [Candidatus Yanofskybacteria bacterium]|nr:hypothetical protein [Candidatus Yanofskybacteria bacterium]